MRAKRSPEADESAAVYRLWAADGTLLYIGSAYDPEARYRVHEGAPWWPLVARRAVAWYGSRQRAYAVEMAAIRKHQPVHNRMGTGRYSTPDTPAVQLAHEMSRARGRAQAAAYRLRRQVIARLASQGVGTAEARVVGETARFAYLRATGLFDDYLVRRKEILALPV